MTNPHENLTNRVWTILSDEPAFRSPFDHRTGVGHRSELRSQGDTQSQSWGLRHESINPFHFRRREDILALMQIFIDRVNHTFFFFKEAKIISAIGVAYDDGEELSNRVMCELCLALAVANQWCDNGNEDGAITWYENGRRYLDDSLWDHEPWVMRAMALISMYHLGGKPDNAQQYLSEYFVSAPCFLTHYNRYCHTNCQSKQPFCQRT